MFNTQQMLTNKNFFIQTVLSCGKRNVALGPDSVPASQEAEVGVLEQKGEPI